MRMTMTAKYIQCEYMYFMVFHYWPTRVVKRLEKWDRWVLLLWFAKKNTFDLKVIFSTLD